MKNTYHYCFLVVCLLLSSTASTFSQESTNEPDLSESFRLIDTWLKAQYQYDQLPGISVAIVKDQEVLFSKGYGWADTEQKVPATSETLYSICSISKLFTAVAVMKLRDEGKLSLEDTIEDLLPWYDLEQAHENSGPITVRSLLTHSSGLPRESAHPYWTGPDFPFPNQTEVRRGLRTQETLYPASTYFQYSNLGLTLLGEIVSEVADMPYDEFVEQNILRPLELKDTYTELPEDLWGNKLATGYGAQKRDGSRDKQKRFEAAGITAAAGYSSSVEDLGKFASWQFRLLEAGGEEILKAPTLREMQRVHWMNPDWTTSWGLGFSVYEVDGKTMVGHGGSCPGYRSTLVLDPSSQYAFIVMINASGENPSTYARAMRSIVMEGLKGKQKEVPEDGPDLEAYAGTYDLQPWWGEEVILPWKGQLVTFGIPSENPAKGFTKLKHIEGNRFRKVRKDGTLGEAWEFKVDDRGKVHSYLQHSNVTKKLE